MADTPLSSTPGGYSSYGTSTRQSDDEDTSYAPGSNYGANTTPYATPHATPYGQNNNDLDDDDVDMLQDQPSNDNKKFIKFKSPQIQIKSLEPQAIDIVLTDCDLSFANAIRRICIAEVCHQ